MSGVGGPLAVFACEDRVTPAMGATAWTWLHSFVGLARVCAGRPRALSEMEQAQLTDCLKRLGIVEPGAEAKAGREA